MVTAIPSTVPEEIVSSRGGVVWMGKRVVADDRKRAVMVKKIILLLCLMLIFSGFVNQPLHPQTTDSTPPEAGVVLTMSLPIPEKPEEQQYLGLGGKGTFTITEIRADVVILEIFSMYCPFCQREAPNVKALYGMIDQNEDLKNRIKIIAVGVGNSPFEVNTYKNAYAMPFPHFADPNFLIHDTLGRVRTPYFIVVKINRDGSPETIYSKAGTVGEPRTFLELITVESGLKEGR